MCVSFGIDCSVNFTSQQISFKILCQLIMSTPSKPSTPQFIKSRSTASAQLSAYAWWLQTHRQTPITVNAPPISLRCTWQGQSPNIDRCAQEGWPWPLTLTLIQGYGDVKKKRFFGIWHWPLTLCWTLWTPLVQTVDQHAPLRPLLLVFGGLHSAQAFSTDLRTWPTILS